MFFVFLTQALSKCEKIVEMGKKLIFSKTQPTKPLYKSMKKGNNFLDLCNRSIVVRIYLRISLTHLEGFLIFKISNFPI